MNQRNIYTMKKPKTNVFGLVAFAVALLCIPLLMGGYTTNEFETSEETALWSVKDNLVGGWAYTVEGAPEGYHKGFLLIVNQDGDYKVQVQTAGATMQGQNVSVKKNTITFDLSVEGDMVKVALTADGSKISGTSTASDGVYQIKGVKSLSAG